MSEEPEIRPLDDRQREQLESLLAAYIRDSEAGTARLWNIADGTQLKQFDAKSVCNDVTVAPNGRHAAIASGGKVGMWDFESGETIHLLEHNLAKVLSVAFSPDGREIATGSGDKVASMETKPIIAWN